VTPLERLRRLTTAERRLLMRAFVLVVKFRLALSLLPWRHLIAFTNRPTGRPARGLTAERMEWAVRSASRGVPRATCLTQALALNQLLASEDYPCVLHIGVSNDGGGFAAHAWVELHGIPLLSNEAMVRGYSRFLTWPPTPDRP
jgi:hypothetical protein